MSTNVTPSLLRLPKENVQGMLDHLDLLTILLSFSKRQQRNRKYSI